MGIRSITYKGGGSFGVLRPRRTWKSMNRFGNDGWELAAAKPRRPAAPANVLIFKGRKRPGRHRAVHHVTHGAGEFETQFAGDTYAGVAARNARNERRQ